MAEIILALDVADGSAAFQLLDRLPALRWVKVGSILMTREGGDFIAALRERGLNVFLDLKWHDIPNTVAGAVQAARDLGVSMATVHTLGGREMMEAAARASAGSVRLVGVTVLTSHDDTSFGELLGRERVSSRTEALRLAGAAMQAGLDGVVCSAHEIADVRGALGPGRLVVVPGIRRREDSAGDQKRVATPEAAAAAGATHLVVGRPVITAADPAAVLTSMMDAVS